MKIRLPHALLVLFLAGAPMIAVSAAALEREYIYGAELMSAQERENYRRGLRQAENGEARDHYRRQHRERLQQRAQQRGKQLDERGVVRPEGATR